MELEAATKVINDISKRRRGKLLSPGETIAVTAAWSGISYDKAIEMCGETCSSSYVGSQAGPEVWRLLSAEFGSKITKKQLRPSVEERYGDLHADEDLLPSDGNTTKLIGVPPSIDAFIGYQTQIQDCISSILDRRSVFIDGPKGIGKSSLAAHVIQNLRSSDRSPFETYIWKSVYYGPLLSELLADLVGSLGIPVHQLTGIDNLLSPVIQYLSKNRCLLILDEAQILLKGSGGSPSWSQYELKYQDYGIFFRRMIEEQNSSSIVITSRVRFPDWSELSEKGSPVSIVHLSGLEKDAEAFLESKQLKDKHRWPELIDKYGENPLILNTVTKEIKKLYGGSTSEFLDSHSTILADPFLAVLNTEFESQSSLTKLQASAMVVLCELMESQACVYYEDLVNVLISKGYSRSRSSISEAIRVLVHRSLVEEIIDGHKSQFSLTPVVQKYIQSDPLGYVQQKAQSNNG